MKTIENVNLKIKKIETNIQTRPDTAQFIIKNNRQKDITIYSITVIPDKKFKTEGNLFVDMFGTTNNTIFDIKAGDLEDIISIEIALDEGFNFRRNNSLRFFVWREGAGSNIKVTLEVTTGEKIISLTGSGLQKGDRR